MDIKHSTEPQKLLLFTGKRDSFLTKTTPGLQGVTWYTHLSTFADAAHNDKNFKETAIWLVIKLDQDIMPIYN